MQEKTTEDLRVLLVEDSPLLQDMLAEMLEDLPGVTVCACAAGEADAVSRLREQTVDLAIVDLELSEGSGLGVLRHMQDGAGAGHRPRAVVYSSYAHAVVRARCKDLGAEAFFDKALGMDALIDFVEDVVQASPPPG
jgi:CheY-like chemotaxis protein